MTPKLIPASTTGLACVRGRTQFWTMSGELRAVAAVDA
jgi:hypothetical protein